MNDAEVMNDVGVMMMNDAGVRNDVGAKRKNDGKEVWMNVEWKE